MTQSDLLKPLVDAIETVKERIQEHGVSLRKDETRTRAALIDPILQALGWDVSDPGSVTLEYDVSGRKADYALLQAGGRPAATIEAKKLGENLTSHRMQMLNYANASGVDYAGLTDGDSWELYDVFKRGELRERQLLDISLANTSTHEAALKLLLLWQPNIASGEPTEAETSIVGPPTPDDPPTPKPDKTNATDKGWIPLTELQADRDNWPIGIRFAAEEPVVIDSFVAVLVETANWLLSKKVLRLDSMPLESPGGATIANSAPTRANGTPMLRSRQLGDSGIYVDINLSGDGVIRRTTSMLTSLKEDPHSVMVKLKNSG